MKEKKPEKNIGQMVTVVVRLVHQLPDDYGDCSYGDRWYAQAFWKVPQAALGISEWFVPECGLATVEETHFHMGTGDIIVILKLADLKPIVNLLVKGKYVLGQRGEFEEHDEAMEILNKLGVPLEEIAQVPRSELTRAFG